MATEAQTLANRQNAQKSTGPKTPDGKAAISQNAVKHGLSAHNDVISSENQADFDLHRDRILAELNPATPMESMLAERIVSLYWRLKRIGHIQNQTIETMNNNIASNPPLTKLIQSLLPKSSDQPQPTSSIPDSALALGRLAIKDFANARVLDGLLLYERRLENSLYKTMVEFQKLRLIRKLNLVDSDVKESEYLPETYENLH